MEELIMDFTIILTALLFSCAILACLGYYVGRILSLEKRVDLLEMSIKTVFNAGGNQYINTELLAKIREEYEKRGIFK